MSDQPAAVRPSFMKVFIPGLVLGLAIGLLGGAYIGGLMEGNGASGDLPTNVRRGTAAPRDTRPPVTPDVNAPTPTTPTTPEGTTPPATPDPVPATPEEPKPETPAAPK